MADSGILAANAKPFVPSTETNITTDAAKLRPTAAPFDPVAAEASAALADADLKQEYEQFLIEQRIANTVIGLGVDEQQEANDRLDAVSPTALPTHGVFNRAKSASDLEIQEAGELYVLEQAIEDIAVEAAEEEIVEATVNLKQFDVQQEMDLFVAENELADAVVAVGVEEQAEADAALESAVASGALKGRPSATDSEIQNAGELFEMQNEIAELEQAVIQEEEEKLHNGS